MFAEGMKIKTVLVRVLCLYRSGLCGRAFAGSLCSGRAVYGNEWGLQVLCWRKYKCKSFVLAQRWFYISCGKFRSDRELFQL